MPEKFKKVSVCVCDVGSEVCSTGWSQRINIDSIPQLVSDLTSWLWSVSLLLTSNLLLLISRGLRTQKI